MLEEAVNSTAPFDRVIDRPESVRRERRKRREDAERARTQPSVSPGDDERRPGELDRNRGRSDDGGMALSQTAYFRDSGVEIEELREAAPPIRQGQQDTPVRGGGRT